MSDPLSVRLRLAVLGLLEGTRVWTSVFSLTSFQKHLHPLVATPH